MITKPKVMQAPRRVAPNGGAGNRDLELYQAAQAHPKRNPDGSQAFNDVGDAGGAFAQTQAAMPTGDAAFPDADEAS